MRSDPAVRVPVRQGAAAAQFQRRPHLLTRKGKYGLKALIHLAEMPEGQLAFVGDVARTNRIPKKFLDAILGELRNAGFVQSRKGKVGGYRLARPAGEIKVGHVIRVLDGPLAPFPCASRTRYEPCQDCDEATCQVRHMMLEVRNAIAEVLDQHSLASMRDLLKSGAPEAGAATGAAALLNSGP